MWGTHNKPSKEPVDTNPDEENAELVNEIRDLLRANFLEGTLVLTLSQAKYHQRKKDTGVTEAKDFADELMDDLNKIHTDLGEKIISLVEKRKDLK